MIRKPKRLTQKRLYAYALAMAMSPNAYEWYEMRRWLRSIFTLRDADTVAIFANDIREEIPEQCWQH